MASASFGCVGHIRPALWPMGCYCKHKGTEASACYAKRSGFLRFRIAVFVPILSRCPPVRHIGRCTHWAGTHSLESDSRPLLRSCACSVVRHHGAAHWREGAHKRDGRPARCHRMDFLREAILFFKSVCWPISKGPVLLYLYDTTGGPKK